MKKILLFFTALLMISAAYGGADVVVDSGIGVTQNEVSMALSSSGVLIAAYNDDPFISGPGLGVSYSTNGGVTWSSKQLNYPSAFTPPNADAFDPTAAADTLGNLYVAHISTDGNWTAGPVSGLYVHKSTNGGVTWSTPVQVSYDGAPSGSSDPNYRFNDRCQMTADTISTGSYKDNLYTAWIKDNGWNSPGPYSDIYFAYSTNQGASFTASAGTVNDNPWSGNPLTTGDMANMPVPAVAPNGDVYVSWLNYSVWTGGSGTIYLDKSTDGGVSWGTDTAVITINLPPLNLNSGTDARAKGAPVLAASTTTNNELYIVYAADPADPIDEADIYFIKSTNGGSTWSTPKKINDDATQNDQILPWIDVKPDGTIDIAWYDRRNDPFDLDWDVYFTSSSDGGSTFSPNVKISDISFATPTAPWGEKWMGEYLGLVVDSQYAYIGFTSNKTDLRGDIYADSIMNPSACPGGMKGNGTASYPCNITTCDELNRIRDNLTLYYILGNDIDFSDAGCSAYTTGGGFAPIGTFTGTFDGQNHTITGLYINRTTSYIGLFSNNGALIKNLGLVDINVTGYRYVGGLAGYNGGTVSNSYASGAVTGYRDVGRLVGRNYRGTVSNSYATGTVIGHITIGGLVGDNNHGNVINSYATGTVTGTGGSSVGGLVGMSSNYGTVSNSYATGIVTGASNVGGLLGYNVGSVTISNSYAAGTVTGSQSVGGLAGYNGGTISNSYATGSVTGTGNNVGGLVGYHYRGTISNSYATGPVTGSGSEIGGLAGYKDISATISTSYWDVCRTNQSNCTGSGTPANCYGRSFSSYFYDVSNAPMSSWDFTNVWDNSCDDDGYPILQSLDGQSCQSAGTTMKGTGTISDPFNITTCCQLQAMQDNLTAYYILVNDIDCSATNTWSWDGSKYLGFKPVGTSSTQFTGTLDGQGNTITGLYINRPSTIGVGLFGSTNRAIINNVSLKDINITGNNNVGGLAGYISTYSSITYSYANGTVTGNDNVGGLAGALSESSLSSSYSTCTVTGYNALGGLVGFVGVSNIDNSYSTGTVTGNDYVGGLAGTLGDYGSIDNSYSTGTVTANNYVGGLAGRLLDRSHASINDSYSTGTVTGTGNNVSGLVGYLGSTSSIYNSYWDVCRTNQSSCTGNAGTPANCYGKNNQTHQDTDYFYTKTNPPMDVWSNSVWNKTSCPGGYILLLNLAGTCNSNPDPCPCAQCQPPYPQGLLPYCDNNNCPPPDYVCSNPVYGCINDDPDYCGYGYTCDYVGGPAIVPEFSIINIILAIAIVGLGIILIVRKKKK